MPYIVDAKYLALQEQGPTPRPTWTLENIWRGTAAWSTQGWAGKGGSGIAPPPAPWHPMGDTTVSLIYKSNQALLHPPQHFLGRTIQVSEEVRSSSYHWALLSRAGGTPDPAAPHRAAPHASPPGCCTRARGEPQLDSSHPSHQGREESL